jgi:hypothetical protein
MDDEGECTRHHQRHSHEVPSNECVSLPIHVGLEVQLDLLYADLVGLGGFGYVDLTVQGLYFL